MMKGTTMASSNGDPLAELLKAKGWPADLIERLDEVPLSIHTQMRKPAMRYLGKRVKEIKVFDPTGISPRDSITRLDIPKRTVNALRRNGVYLVGDIILLTKSELTAIRNIGPSSVMHTVKRIEQANLVFCESSDESLGDRIGRVFGTVKSAPATSLVPLAPLDDRFYLTFHAYRKFITYAEALTIGELFSLSEPTLRKAANLNNFLSIEDALYVLRGQKALLGE